MMEDDKNGRATVTVLGAAREVTGSCYLVATENSRVLIECGLIQGGRDADERNRADFDFDPATIDALVLTHAHIDHSGRIPLLVKRGFQGPIFAHSACVDLCRVMLRDSAFLQEKDAETENRKRRRRGESLITPLYTQEDAEESFGLFQPLAYDQKISISPGVDICLRDAGHILGSASVEVWLHNGGLTRKLVFSGDLGPNHSLLHHPPVKIKSADLLFMESTYGDRDHRPQDASIDEFAAVIKAAAEDGGNILIPAFAVGRTQELLLLFARHYQDWELNRWGIYLDSPLAIAATRIYARNKALLRAQHLSLDHAGQGVKEVPNLEFTPRAEDSMQLNNIAGGAIIIAGSGMCSGGRIRHHLKHNLWRPECRVVIIGFQAHGTLGRRLVDGADTVRLWGEEIRVRAGIHTIGGFSAHAGRQELLEWYRGFGQVGKTCLTHGESSAAQSLADVIRKESGNEPAIPGPGQSFRA